MDDAAAAGQSSSQSTNHLTPARAKLGLIIPAVNTMSEPQFQHFAPQGLGIHVMCARIAGNPSTTLADLRPTIEQAADIVDRFRLLQPTSASRTHDGKGTVLASSIQRRSDERSLNEGCTKPERSLSRLRSDFGETSE